MFCIIMLEHLSIYIFIFWITFSISMYIMCVCLLSALNCRVGALQISITIIKIWINRITAMQGFRKAKKAYNMLLYLQVLGKPYYSSAGFHKGQKSL